MTIQEIIKECVIGLYKEEILCRTLVLKGGAALHLIENIDSRISIDLDFSVVSEIHEPKIYFQTIQRILTAHFSILGFEVIDADYGKKPKERSEEMPKFWAGWYFEFKLFDRRLDAESIEFKRRAALIPIGSKSSKIRLDISEYEYCGGIRKVSLNGSEVTTYTSTLLVAEKIRAICQQHTDYPYGNVKDRARDFFDIQKLVYKHRSLEFYQDLKLQLPLVFSAKGVDLVFLTKIFEKNFLEFQASHFSSVELMVNEKVEPFEYYSEQLRLLLSDIGAVS